MVPMFSTTSTSTNTATTSITTTTTSTSTLLQKKILCPIYYIMKHSEQRTGSVSICISSVKLENYHLGVVAQTRRFSPGRLFLKKKSKHRRAITPDVAVLIYGTKTEGTTKNQAFYSKKYSFRIYTLESYNIDT